MIGVVDAMASADFFIAIAAGPLEFGWTPGVFAGAALGAVAAVTLWRRKAPSPWIARALLAGGMILLGLALGSPRIRLSDPGEVRVFVDVSASTRTASWREESALNRRIAELLPRGTRYQIEMFGRDGDRTVFSPPEGPDPILLFSDARFDLPQRTGPTHVVIDPALDAPADAAVRRLRLEGREAVIEVHNGSAEPRTLSLSGVDAAPTETITPGSRRVVRRAIAPGAARVTARVEGDDPWPENDAMTMDLTPTAYAERWWVSSDRAAPPGYRILTPAALPANLPAWLAPAVVVLDNVSSKTIGPVGMMNVERYARDFGGAVLILGGDRAFSPGGYEGTILDDVSPLASSPPLPAAQWILLVDASGSMQRESPGGSRFDLAAGAALGVLGSLPGSDPVSIGSFSDRIDWWVIGKSVREARAIALPPAGIQPRGPTDLGPALRQIARQEDSGLARQALVISDAQARLGDIAELIDTLHRGRLRLHVLQVGDDSTASEAQLRRLVEATGGSYRKELSPRRWAQEARLMLAQSSPERMIEGSAPIHADSGLATALGRATPVRWNRTWLKPRAMLLASAAVQGEKVAVAGRWALGAGEVMAVALRPEVGTGAALAETIARRARDPRYHVSWDTGSSLTVRLDTLADGEPINRLAPTLELAMIEPIAATTAPTTYWLEQTAPGRYEVSIDAPRRSSLASVRVGDQLADRKVLSGEYPPEFDEIGNDYAAMRRLADSGGGSVIQPTQLEPIRLHWPTHAVSAAPTLALLGTLLMAIGLIVWRLGV